LAILDKKLIAKDEGKGKNQEGKGQGQKSKEEVLVQARQR
jgi:hypothetical protein